eukprot:2806459-Rhodomonas_salina.1
MGREGGVLGLEALAVGFAVGMLEVAAARGAAAALVPAAHTPHPTTTRHPNLPPPHTHPTHHRSRTRSARAGASAARVQARGKSLAREEKEREKVRRQDQGQRSRERCRRGRARRQRHTPHTHTHTHTHTPCSLLARRMHSSCNPQATHQIKLRG